MSITEIIDQYGVFAYAIVLFFGGRWGLKYFDYFKKTKYNFLAFATFFGFVFIGIQYYTNSLNLQDVWKYLLTYTVVTSCYEFLSDFFPFLKPKKDQP